MRIPISGLWTNPNDFDAPPGSTELLLNMTQDRPGIWETRRGFTLLEPTVTITGPINAITSFRGNIIVHHSTASISRWTGSAWSTYSGTFTPPTQASSGRVRFFTANESLFVTTTAGVYELDSPTGTWRLTGAPKALDGTATLRRTVNETGFATANGQWAYRDEWGIKNANGRLQLGAPSGRMLVVNPANVTATTGNVAKLNGSTTVTVTNTTHGFATGEYVDVTLGVAETYFAAGTFQVTVVSSTSFTYSDAVNNGSGVTQNPGASITYGFSNGRGVTRTIPIPSGITTDYFVQVYRSAKSASATSEPSDQLAQVYERSPTNLEITAGSMTVTDIVPDDFRGALMDVSAETVLAAKERPPTAADAAQYHNCEFYAATTGTQAMDLQVIAVGTPNGMVAGDAVRITDRPTDVSNNTWAIQVEAAAAEDFANGKFKLFTTGSTSQNIADTARSMVRCINYRASTFTTKAWAEYISGDQEAPGKFRVYGQTPVVGQFSVVGLAQAGIMFGTAFIPALPTGATILNIARAASTVTVNTNIPHGFATGQTIELAFSTNTGHFANGIKTVASAPTTTQFTYTESGSAVVAEGNDGVFLNAPAADLVSDVIDRSDRLAYALPDEPWAVPSPNELFIEGEPTTTSSLPTIHRVLANRDRLYVLADSGLFEVTGFYPDFSVRTLQSPHKLLAAEAAVSQGTPGRIYGLANQGAEEVLTSANVISTPIQDILQDAQVNFPSALKNYAFAVAYPSDYKVLFFMPEASTDTKATNAYVFHTRTGEWSRWDTDATCGMVDPVTDKLYLGRSDGAVWVERKARTLADYWDPGTTQPVTYNYSAIVGTDITVDVSVSGLTVGDVIKDRSSNTRTKITAINGLTVSVLSVSGFSAPGAFDVEHIAYTQTIRPTRFFGKEGPNVDKAITSGMLLVQPPASSAEFTTVTAAFRNDYSPSFSAAETLTLDSVMTSQLLFKVPLDMQQSGWLQAQFVHDTGGERLRVLGYSLNVSPAGPKEGY